MHHLKAAYNTDDLTFPLLVDYTRQADSCNEKNDHETTINTNPHDPVVIHQSFDILTHLWDRYGQSVLPNDNSASSNPRERADQWINGTSIPFVFRFLSLASPSYFRAWPTCGIFQTTSLREKVPPINVPSSITLYQTEGCWESRLVREALCTLEIPYRSVPVGEGSSNQLPTSIASEDSAVISSTSSEPTIPLLVITHNEDDDHPQQQTVFLQGADDCVNFLWETFRDPQAPLPHFGQDLLWGRLENVGRRHGSFGLGAYTAFVKGRRAFVPEKALVE